MIPLNVISIWILLAAGISAVIVTIAAYRDPYSLLSHTGMFIIGIVFGVSASALILLRIYDS